MCAAGAAGVGKVIKWKEIPCENAGFEVQVSDKVTTSLSLSNDTQILINCVHSAG